MNQNSYIVIGFIILILMIGLYYYNMLDVKTEIFFAKIYNNNNSVSTNDWNNYLNSVVTPLFPEGLTMKESYGQAYDGQKIRYQSNFELMITHKNTSDHNDNTLKIISEYRKLFPGAQVFMLKTYGFSTFYHN